MTPTMEPARHYEAAIRAMSEAAATAEATHAPIRLAYWRMAALDTLLARLEELRLAGEREMPEDTLELVVTFAQRHDHELRDRLQEINAEDVNVVHDAVFEAQGRVMLSLAELRRVPNWQDLDLVLEPGGEEAA
ncbi:MAG TPA: hypothetical protein VIO62_06675 [Candidatus Dormibacteraeota bacterium]